MKKSASLLLMAATAGLLGAFNAATAQVSDTRTAAINRAPGTCDGFGQEAVSTNTQNASTSTSSAVFGGLATTSIPGGGSGGGVDLYTITFSGEASASGGGSIEVQAQVSINGGAFINIEPVGPNTFHSGNAAQTHTMTWCREIVANSTNFRIVWRKVGGGTAFMDDYLMRVERSN